MTDRTCARWVADLERLNAIQRIVVVARAALVPHLAPLAHPDARWHPADLDAALAAALPDIAAERARLRGPLIREDDDA